MTEINTKKAERRALKFTSLDELSAELDRIESASRAGTLTTTGNWSPGQILQHCAIFMRCAIDGFPGKGPPAIMRWVFTMLFKKKAASGAQPPTGFKIPQAASFLSPSDSVSFDDGIGELRSTIARVTEKGEQFSHPSPLFGKFTHEQWTKLQLGHCAMHISFISLDGATEAC